MPGHIIPKGKTAKGPGINAAPGTILPDGKIAEIAIAAGFPDSEVPTAVAVALAESGGRVDATNHNSNGTVDHGLWQINDVNLKTVGSTGQQLEQDPQVNGNAAHTIWQNAGNKWSPWTTYTSGRYLAFLARGRKALKDAQNNTIGQSALNTAGSAVDAIVAPFKDLVSAISFLFSKQFLYLVFGAVVVLMALYLVVRSSSGGKSVTTKIVQAAKAAPKIPE